MARVMVVVLFVYVVAAMAAGVYRSVSRYVSVADLLRLAVAAVATSLAVAVIAWAPPSGLRYLPLSVPAIGCLVLLTALGSVRIGARLKAQRHRRRAGDAERVLIVGAGDAGEMVARDMLRGLRLELRPIGFLDDDPAKRGQRIHGVRVLGLVSDLEEVVRRTRPDHVLIAMPGIPSRTLQPILHRVVATGVNAKILPTLREVIGGPTGVADIRDVDVADLIGREPVRINDSDIAACLAARVVLVTGAAGSIGSELARQALRFRPAGLFLLDNNESDLFGLWQELAPLAGAHTRLEMVVGDIRDRRRIHHIFEVSRPHIVLHAAAYKHVPIMEDQAAEAVKTNVMGTGIVAEAAARSSAERFVLVSTDKAVRPTSVMGATKRVAEMLVARVAEGSATIFAAVRFGNVLGSRGSVVPIFAKQIGEGGPITVTHPEVSRYFMTIEEAAALILQAGSIASGGDTFVLDMGEPVRILDLAERMRDLLAPAREIDLTFTGLRPGEKLHEDLWQTDEVLNPTSHPRILRAVAGEGSGAVRRSIEASLRRLEELAIWNAHPDEIRAHLFSITSNAPEDAVLIPDPIMSDLASSPKG